MMAIDGIFKLTACDPRGSFIILGSSILLIFLIPDTLSGSRVVDDNLLQKGQRFLKNFKVTHMDSVSTETLCPEESNTYITGARIRLSDHLNQSKPVVTAIEVICSDGIRTRVWGSPTLLLDQNMGNWTEVKECPNGQFVTDVIFNLEYFATSGLIAFNLARSMSNPDDGFNHKSTGVDIRFISKDKFVAGITMNCTFRGDGKRFVPSYDDNENDNKGDKGQDDNNSTGLEWSSFVLGYATGYGLRIYCLKDRVISGIFVRKQALVSSVDGERMLPVKMTIKCEELFNPARDCHPELGWDPMEFGSMHCFDPSSRRHLNSSIISEADPHPPNIQCHVRHSMGSTLNDKITNLKQILAAYKTVGMEENVGVILVPKLLSPRFRSEWQHTYKLEYSQYEKAVREQPYEKYLHLHKHLVRPVEFKNITYELPQGANASRGIAGNGTLSHQLVISQLVGYCSVYKVYFPVFKSEMINSIRRNADGLEREIVFEKLKK